MSTSADRREVDGEVAWAGTCGSSAARSERHRGTSYKAANWINVGKTVGRGKKSRVHEQIIPIKDIWLYPLQKNFRTVLCA